MRIFRKLPRPLRSAILPPSPTKTKTRCDCGRFLRGWWIRDHIFAVRISLCDVAPQRTSVAITSWKPKGNRTLASVTFYHHPTPKQKPDAIASGFVGGGWWIRTTEVSDNRFTVCPLWPLGKSPIFLELVNGVEPSTC